MQQVEKNLFSYFSHFDVREQFKIQSWHNRKSMHGSKFEALKSKRKKGYIHCKWQDQKWLSSSVKRTYITKSERDKIKKFQH